MFGCIHQYRSSLRELGLLIWSDRFLCRRPQLPQMHSLLRSKAHCSISSVYGMSTTQIHRSSTAWLATCAPAHQLVQQQRQHNRQCTALLAIFYLGPLEYPSKQAAARVAKDLLDKNGVGREFHPGDSGFEFLWHAWQHHHSAHAHAHKGVRHFSIRRDNRSAYIPTICFWVHFLDGDSRDFSYKKVLDSKEHAEVMRRGGWTGLSAPKTAAELAAANQAAQAFAQQMQHLQTNQHKQPVPNEYYYSSLRLAVEGQIVQFRVSAQRKLGYQFKCPITNVWVTFDQAHVDHSTAFIVLVHHWLQQEGLQLTDVPHGDWLQEHQHMLESWQDYHRSHAKLRMVSSTGNLQQSHQAKLALAAARSSSTSSSSSGDVAVSESCMDSSSNSRSGSRSSSSSESSSSSNSSSSSKSCSSRKSSSSGSAVEGYTGTSSSRSTAVSSSSEQDTASSSPHRRRRRHLSFM